ncbi:MAG: hypothetical protein WD572_02985 [Gammaproteobacteria bacterium]
MSDRLRLPTEAELPGLIRAAFEQAPGPDAERLEMIFARLPARSLHPQRRLALWWAIVLMGSGAALAAWGVHEIIESAREQPQREYAMPPQPASISTEARPKSFEVERETAETESKGEQEQKSGPIIYLREAP